MEQTFGRQGKEIDAVKTGKRIQEIRKQKGLRVTDISDYMGFYEPQAVYKWMRGASLPTLQNMYQLSQLFGVSMDEIIRVSESTVNHCVNGNRTEKEWGGDKKSPSLFLRRKIGRYKRTRKIS